MPGGEAFRLTGQHKPMRVEGHAAPSEPLRPRVRAHENEHMPDRPFFLETCLLVAPGHRVKALLEVTVKLCQFRVRAQLDIRRGINTVDQVA
jgi:hypothetical protein